MPDLVAAALGALGAVSIAFIPVLVWLVFWLFEDFAHPEPRYRILVAFLAGMLAVPVVLSLEGIAFRVLPYGQSLFAVWAVIEEVVKVAFAALFVLRHRSVDEPIDYPIYMITVALGFAAVENTLFILSPLMAQQYLEGAVTGDLRFLGATLIHVLGSAIIGGTLAFSFFRSTSEKIMFVVVGVILAAGLHTFFNLLILSTGAEKILTIFLGVWVGIVFLLLGLERIKLMRPPSWWERVKIL